MKKKRRGFTLIEIMIVISIIGMLSVVLIPKVGGLKTETKNNSMSGNVLIVRSYLENRASKDVLTYKKDINVGTAKEAALTNILAQLSTDMTEKFSASNAMINPFSNSSYVNTLAKVSATDTTSASSIINYYSLDDLPTSDSSVTSNASMPKGEGFSGNVITVLYEKGYLLYGVDNDGNITDINIIKFPTIPDAVVSGVTPGTGEVTNDTAMKDNVAKVVEYIKSFAVERIISGEPNSHTWDYIRNPLASDLNAGFTPGNATKQLINPYHEGVDTIGTSYGKNKNNELKSKEYSIIEYHEATVTDDIESRFSEYEGAVVVYVTDSPLGYVVYGVDQDGNTVERTEINLSTLVTEEMEIALSDNILKVYNELSKYIDTAVKYSYKDMDDYAYYQLENLSIANAYVPNWEIEGWQTYNFDTDKSFVVEQTAGGYESDYKGSVIVSVLDDGSGYSIFGIDYEGNKYGEMTLTEAKNNYDEVLKLLKTVDFNYDANIDAVQTALKSEFGTSLKNLYNNGTEIVKITNSTVNYDSSVIICSSNNLKYINSDKLEGHVLIVDYGYIYGKENGNFNGNGNKNYKYEEYELIEYDGNGDILRNELYYVY
ncbi:MAG: prepilin-type N-terminal cleavage/methylation domain-containing protein [Clostridiaceae bacterium]